MTSDLQVIQGQKSRSSNNVVVYNGKGKIFNYHEFKENGPNDRDNDRQPEVAIYGRPSQIYL